MDSKIIYSKTITEEGNDCLITKEAHVVEIQNMANGDIEGYVATCSTIYRGWMGIDSRSQSAVYTDRDMAIDYCNSFLTI